MAIALQREAPTIQFPGIKTKLFLGAIQRKSVADDQHRTECRQNPGDLPPLRQLSQPDLPGPGQLQMQMVLPDSIDHDIL